MSEDSKKEDAVLSDVQREAWNAEIGQKAIVQREDLTGEKFEIANETLNDTGVFLRPAEGINYLGSAAVHIYGYPKTGALQFASQVTTLGETPEHIASAAFSDLRGAMMEAYGRKRHTKRSGF